MKCSHYDHKTNKSIRKELRITNILDKIDEYRKEWLLHIQRMPQNRIPLKSYNYRPQGRRSIGRPKKRWREQLQPWRRNGSKGPILGVYDDDDVHIKTLKNVPTCFDLIQIIFRELICSLLNLLILKFVKNVKS